MAALRGILQGNRGEVSRLGSKNSGIYSTLNTWRGRITTCLSADGFFRVSVSSDYAGGPTKEITGNVNTGTMEAE